MQDTEATTTTSRRDSSDEVAECRKPLDLVVDRAVLLDVGVGLGDVGLGLVIVVVRDEVLDGVVRQHLPQFVGELRGEGLVRGHHQGGTLQPLDEPGRGGRLAGAGGAEQNDVTLPRPDPALQILDRGGLITGGLEFADHLELRAGTHQIADSAILGVRQH